MNIQNGFCEHLGTGEAYEVNDGIIGCSLDTCPYNKCNGQVKDPSTDQILMRCSAHGHVGRQETSSLVLDLGFSDSS